MKATLGPYTVEAEIGRGGMGVVYRARGAGGPVAIKLLQRRDNVGATQRFDRERRLLSSLGEADGFVPLLDSGHADGAPFIVMPLLEGGTLRDRLRRGPLPPDEVRALGIVLARALGRAHALGIVHRDMKPENVLFAKPGDELPLVADLGLARHFRHDVPGASQSAALTAAGEWRGTVGYMPLEQVRGASELGPAADVFALGAVLYECLAGEGPFNEPNVLLTLERLEKGSFRPLATARPGLSPSLARTIDRALAREPADRFPDGNAFALALEAVSLLPRRRAVASGVVSALALVAALGGALARGRLGGPGPGAASPLPRASAVSPSPGPSPPPSPAPTTGPAWLDDLAPADRPRFPLPAGLEPSEKPREYVHRPTGASFVYVPAGEFLMGSESGPPDTAPVHTVSLSAYFFGKLEVTVAEFTAFVAATGYETEAERKGVMQSVGRTRATWTPRKGASWRHPEVNGPAPGPDHPVCGVSWNDAKAYCAWAGLALPTEAEWERAALWDPRARRSSQFSWGDTVPSASSAKLANLPDETALKRWPDAVIFDGYDDGYALTSPVGAFPAGAAPSGALDTIGNVCEWCEDGYDGDFYKVSPQRDPIRPGEGRPRRVWRGGNFLKVYEGGGWFRGFRETEGASDTLGFRCAIDARAAAWR